METAVRRPARVVLADGWGVRWRAVAAWALPFAFILYLALKGGGYDAAVRGQVGVAVWWVVLLGALVGALPAGRVSRAGWTALALLTAFAVWTKLGAGWSESPERSIDELGRVAAYIGFLAFALAALRDDMLRPALQGAGCAIAAVAILAVLSRLHPSWFPADQTAGFLPGTQSRLNYPLNYWNGLAALVALGLPLVLGMASAARTLAGRALAAAALPVMGWCLFLTFSRGGAAAAALGLIAFFALARGRLMALATALVAGAGTAILIAATVQRHALERGLRTAAGEHEGSEMLAMALVVAAGVALLCTAIGLVERHGEPPRWLPAARRRLPALIAAGAVIGVVAALTAGAPGAMSDAWRDFKRPDLGVAADQRNLAARFGSTSGNGRYQYWTSATRGAGTNLLEGTGPGTFGLWWPRDAPFYSYVRNAHSLYLETLGETGLVGLALILAFLVTVLLAGGRRAVRAGPGSRPLLAAATAGCVAFCVSAGTDWIWQIPVLPASFFLLAAIVLTGAGSPTRAGRHGELAIRAVLAVAAVLAALVIIPPLAGTVAVRESQAQAAADRLGPAFAAARAGAAIQPVAAAPRLQEALVLEQAGAYDAAAQAAGAAARAEPLNWRNWFILARIQAERGRPAAALAAYRRARALNPRSPLFRR